MNRELPRNRRRARAIAISEGVRTAAVVRMALMALAGAAALVEGVILVQRLWAVHA